MELPILAPEEAIQEVQTTERELKDWVHRNSRNPFTAAIAQKASNAFVKYMMTIRENGKRRTILFNDAVAIPELNLYSSHSKLARVYAAAREWCLQNQRLSPPIGEVHEHFVGQTGLLLRVFQEIESLRLLPSQWADVPSHVERTRIGGGHVFKDIGGRFTVSQFDATVVRVDQPLIITGPPGVGKTTVAMKRLNYLLQLESDPERKSELEELRRRYGKDSVRFTPESVRVLVRRPHLQQYLANYAADQRIPPNVVMHVDNFLAEYCRELGGKKRVRFESMQNDSYRKLKSRVEWDDIHDFVIESGRERDVLREADVEIFLGIAQYLEEVAQDPVLDQPEVIRLKNLAQLISGEAVLNAEGASAAIMRVLDALERELPQSQDKSLGARNRQLREIRAEWRSKLRTRQDRYSRDWNPLETLYRFYLSNHFINLVASQGLDTRAWESSVAESRKNNSISQSDFLVLAALAEAIHLEHPDAGVPVRRLSHIVIDESQLMPPILLRLIADRWCGSLRSCTMVGDPNQSAVKNSDSEYFTRIPEVITARLNVMHRVTSQQFEFLARLAEVLNVDEEIRPSPVIRSGPLPVVLSTANSFEEELHQVVDVVMAWREADPNAKIVMVPCPSSEDGEMEAMADLVAELAYRVGGFSIKKQLKGGFSISDQEPVMAHVDSLIGLEFDYVVLFNCRDYTRNELIDENRGSLWIAASRPVKHFVVVLPANATSSVFSSARFDSAVTRNVSIEALLTNFFDRHVGESEVSSGR